MAIDFCAFENLDRSDWHTYDQQLRSLENERFDGHLVTGSHACVDLISSAHQ
jgi:hypothetical protein